MFSQILTTKRTTENLTECVLFDFTKNETNTYALFTDLFFFFQVPYGLAYKLPKFERNNSAMKSLRYLIAENYYEICD